MAKKKPAGGLTAAELGSAEAQGMTPEEYLASYSAPGAARQAGGTQRQKGESLGQVAADIGEFTIGPISGAISKDIFGGGGSPKAGAAGGGAETVAGDAKEIKKLQGELKTAQAGEAQKTAEDAYTTLADKQANQYLQMTKSLDPLTSGAALPAIEGTASANAAQMLGQSATSPVSQWLNAQTSAAQAQNAPAQAANAQVGIAQDYASTLLASGLQNMGQAETKMMQAAPYQQLLSTLAADIPYKLLGGSETFPQLQSDVATSINAIPGLSTTAVSAGAASPQAPKIDSGIIPPAPSGR